MVLATRVDANDCGSEDLARWIPVISCGAGHLHDVDDGLTAAEPQSNAVDLVPFGSHVPIDRL
jgi:hypothetical protein